MTRRLLTCLAGAVLALSLYGCGGGDPDIPEGHSAQDIRKPTDAPKPLPSRDIEGPTKSGG